MRMRPSCFLVPAALHAQMITANPCNLLTPAEVLSATQDSVRTTALSQFQAPVCTIITSDSNATISVKIETTRDYDDGFWDGVGDSTKHIPSLGEKAVVTGNAQPVTKVLRRGHVTQDPSYVHQPDAGPDPGPRESARLLRDCARAVAAAPLGASSSTHAAGTSRSASGGQPQRRPPDPPTPSRRS